MHRRLFAFLALLLLLMGSASCSGPPAAPPPGGDLDRLFQRLQSTQSEEEAQRVEVAIRRVWSRSGRAGVDALAAHAVEAMHAGQYNQALAFLDKVVETAPQFAEGWNLRATVHYLRDDFRPAVADIGHVLSLEPRHFGALAGLGRIMLEMEDRKAALWAFERALAVNPHLPEVRDQIEQLQDELAGLPI
jgi:tetratricopeptide (TPR) repeat protein